MKPVHTVNSPAMPVRSAASMHARAAAGGLAGLIATAPMTAFMEAAFPLLRWREQQPLPPRKVTRNLTRSVGLWQRLRRSQRTLLTWCAHFAYGGLLGSMYAGLVPPSRWSSASGVCFGLIAWAGNYLGLLPALGLHPSAVHHPRRRNWLMIGAHFVWGLALGALLARLSRAPHLGK